MQRAAGVLVVGGGPAGLAAAIAARKKGLPVTVADGAKPPIDKACGEGLLPGTLAALGELDVSIDHSDGQIFRRIRFIDGATFAEAGFTAESGIGVRRTILHEKMVARAEQCGVQRSEEHTSELHSPMYLVCRLLLEKKKKKKKYKI